MGKHQLIQSLLSFLLLNCLDCIHPFRLCSLAFFYGGPAVSPELTSHDKILLKVRCVILAIGAAAVAAVAAIAADVLHE